MKYRSTDIVEPNGIRSARTDWWPVGIALSSVKRVPLRTRLQIGLTAPHSSPHFPLWNCLLTEDRWLPFDFHLSRNSPFDLPTIRGRRLIAPETRPIPETRTRGPIPRLFIHPQRTTWNELNFWSFIVIFRYLSTIFQLKAIELLYVMIRLLEFDYHGQSCQSKILFRFNFSILWVVLEIIWKMTWLFFYLKKYHISIVWVFLNFRKRFDFDFRKFLKLRNIWICNEFKKLD